MTNLKIYNKQSELSVVVENSKNIKTVYIYKYNKETVSKHRFSFISNNIDLHKRISYYDLTINAGGITKETVSISDDSIVCNEYVDDMSTISVSKKLKTGNIYTKKTIYFEGEKHEIEFKNGYLFNLPAKIKEDVIKEYINKTK